MGLDLSRIEAWTRSMLEAEARRRGIRGTEFRARGELVRLILRHQYGDRLNAGRDRIAQSRRALSQARELFGVAVSAALSVLPEPMDVLTRLRGRLPDRTSVGGPTPMRVPVPNRAEVTESPVDPAPNAAEPAPAALDGSIPAASELPSRQTSVVVPTTRTFVEEPIRTRSMARLLAAQGHRARALLIYEELLAQNSEDPELRIESERVRRGEAIDAPLLPEPRMSLERFSVPLTDDRLHCEGEPNAGFVLRWHVTELGLRRARAVLGCEGELSIRVIEIRPDPDDVVRSEITEHGPVPCDGEWRTPALPAAARCFAAVGLREGTRFVAIVHTHPGPRRVEDAGDAERRASA